MLGIAIAITSEAFKNKKDKGGNPYVLHCLRVMFDGSKDEESMCIRVLHDLVEDTDWTIEKLRALNVFTERVLKGVESLTHDKDVPYDTYIHRIGLNEDKEVINAKLADLRDNSNITRLKGLTKSDFDRMEKYHRSFVYLSKV